MYPEEDDLNMSITISTSSTNPDDITLSIGKYVKGYFDDLTEHIFYEFSKKVKEGEKREVSIWQIDMDLSYPHAEGDGFIVLSVGDSRSGAITTTHLLHIQEDKPPYFDPIPKSVVDYIGEDILIDTRAKGSSPIKVIIWYISAINKLVHW